MNVADVFNVGSLIKAEVGLDAQTVNSCTTSAGDTLFGPAIDRLALRDRYRSAKVVLGGSAVLTQATSTHGITAVLVPGIQHSSDATSWDAWSTGTVPSKTLGVTTSATATGARGTAEQSVNLSGARRYVRMTASAAMTLSTSTTDSVAVAGTIVFGGGETTPATS